MTERGLPLADGASACPFVAFDDDRDERSSVPDHRHRCFAEPQPAPRALAHQEAYCLSSAFPVCPTFQDWARREAARSRDAGAGARATPTAARAVDRGSADPPVVAPGLAAVAAAASDGDARELDPAAVQRGVEDRDPRGSDSTSSAGAAAAAGAAIGAAGSAVGAAGAHRGGSDETDDPVDERRAARPDDLAQRNPPRDWSAPPPWLASAEARRGDDAQPPSFLGRRASEPGQGLAGSPADQMAGGEATQPRPRDDEEWTSSARTAPPPRQAPARGQAAIDDPDEDLDRDDEPDGRRATRRPRAYAQHLGGPDGPDWERPRRYEAYPTIKTRVGIPRLPPIALMAAVIVIAALALFLLPGILNLGGTSPKGSAAPSSALPSVSLPPSVAPEPTPTLYTIKKGDTLSKIAKANGITIEELLAANPTIKNPNTIGEGQQIIIPVPSEEPPTEVGGSGAP